MTASRHRRLAQTGGHPPRRAPVSKCARGVRVPQVMEARQVLQACAGARRPPDHTPEPVTPDVLVFSRHAPEPKDSACRVAAPGPVVRERTPTVGAAAFPGCVGAECAVSVLAACLVRLGEAECAGNGNSPQWRWLRTPSREPQRAVR
jgi:hypothetical protein